MKYSDKNLPDLTKTELQILNVVWKSKEGLSIREVHSEISQKNNWAYSTTKTTMDRMVKKGLLERADFHGVFLYQAKISRPVGLARMVSYFFNDVLEFDTRSIVSTFAKSNSLSSEEIEELENILESAPDNKKTN